MHELVTRPSGVISGGIVRAVVDASTLISTKGHFGDEEGGRQAILKLEAASTSKVAAQDIGRPQGEALPGSTSVAHSYADLRELERRMVLEALEITDGKIAGKRGAATLLGVPPSTLTSKLTSLGIQKVRKTNSED